MHRNLVPGDKITENISGATFVITDVVANKYYSRSTRIDVKKNRCNFHDKNNNIYSSKDITIWSDSISGSHDNDFEIMLWLNDKTLRSFLCVNRKVFKFIYNVNFWRRRMIIKGLENLIQYKPDNLSIRRQYYSLQANLKNIPYAAGRLDLIIHAFNNHKDGNIIYDENSVKDSIERPNITRWLLDNNISPPIYLINKPFQEQLPILEIMKSKGIYPCLRDAEEAIHYNNLELLQWIISEGVILDSDCANFAIAQQSFTIYQWLKFKGIYPTVMGANYLIQGNNLSCLIELSSHNIFPDVDGANYAFCYNSDVSEWLMSQRIYPDHRCMEILIGQDSLSRVKWLLDHNIFPTETIIRNVVIDNDITTLELFADYGCYPSTDDANYAICSHNITMLEWMDMYSIYPNSEGANNAYILKYDKIIRFLNNHNIYPTLNTVIQAKDISMINKLHSHNIVLGREHIDDIISTNNLDLLLRVYTNGIIPTSEDANLAVKNTNNKILQWFLANSIFPTTPALNSILDSGSDANAVFIILNTLAQYNIFPDSDGADIVASSNLNILKWLIKHGIFPTANGVNECIVHHRTRNFNWLYDNNFFPNVIGVNYATVMGYTNILSKCLDINIYPDINSMNKAYDSGKMEIINILKGRQVLAYI